MLLKMESKMSLHLRASHKGLYTLHINLRVFSHCMEPPHSPLFFIFPVAALLPFAILDGDLNI